MGACLISLLCQTAGQTARLALVFSFTQNEYIERSIRLHGEYGLAAPSVSVEEARL